VLSYWVTQVLDVQSLRFCVRDGLRDRWIGSAVSDQNAVRQFRACCVREPPVRERHAIFQRQQDREMGRGGHLEVRHYTGVPTMALTAKQIVKSIVPPLLWNIGRNLKRRFVLSVTHFQYAPRGMVDATARRDP
jgi:hypothetical protein